MKIIRDKLYLLELDLIIDYIAQSSLSASIKFLNKLDSKIDNISTMPYKYRKSNYYEDENIRDFIFKGYTIPYLIDKNNNAIVLLDTFKWSHRDSSL